MKIPISLRGAIALSIATALLIASSAAQSPSGYAGSTAPSAPLLGPSQLQELVGRFALYPDDLIALVLPVSED